ncbi:MAG: DNA-binding response regulator, partial [Lacticaseibacillus paracasei]|nr:DNA-binding response regulator [Lacticaseibacillus paracasei]
MDFDVTDPTVLLINGANTMKILIVDDDKEIVELLSIYVKNEGYEPIQAYS